MQGSRTVVGVDIAKRVFQLHWVDVETGEIVGRTYRAAVRTHEAQLGDETAAVRSTR